ncbi:MAG: ABC transporter permease [Pseudomonadota bacterium]
MLDSILNAVGAALGALRVNFLRSRLSMLGIVIGVGAVIVMVGIGMGARELINERIRSMGSNIVLLIPGASKQGGVHTGSGTVHTLTSRDAEAMAKNRPSAAAASPDVL